ncbi:MAG: MFS transporter, partial [Candidatus Eremiobacteraeota bacterium]|nr:MFS transporter [Candidatus Eremiobacteraeota bacterium]
LGIQAVWGALLGISLQARTIELVGGAGALLAYGRLATLGAIVAALVQVAVGPLSDARRRRGSRRLEFYAAGAIAGAAALVLFFQATNFATLTLTFIALQAGLNCAIGPYQAIIPDVVARAKFGTASSWMAALQSAGNAVGAVFAAYVSNARLLGGALAALLLGTSAVTSAHLRALSLQPVAERTPLRITRAFVDLFISRALVYVGFYTLLGYLLFYVRDVLAAPSLAAAKSESGVLILAFTLVGTVGAALAARPSDRRDKRLIANVGGGIVIVALVLFIVTSGFMPAVAATLIAGVGWGIFLVADWAIACRVLPPSALATTMGVWNLAVILPQIIAPALTTVVLTRFALHGPQGPKAAFGLAVVETFVGVVWLWRLSPMTIGE